MSYNRSRRRKRDENYDIERERHLRRELKRRKRELLEEDEQYTAESYTGEELRYKELWEDYDKNNEDFDFSG